MKNSKGNKNYDVRFDDDTCSNSMGFAQTYEYCYDWIHCNRNDKSSYFGDYKGGVVCIVNTISNIEVYIEEIN